MWGRQDVAKLRRKSSVKSVLVEVGENRCENRGKQQVVKQSKVEQVLTNSELMIEEMRRAGKRPCRGEAEKASMTRFPEVMIQAMLRGALREKRRERTGLVKAIEVRQLMRLSKAPDPCPLQSRCPSRSPRKNG